VNLKRAEKQAQSKTQYSGGGFVEITIVPN
jgi:hypothetical protein